MTRRSVRLISSLLACGMLAAACGSSGAGGPGVASISSSPSGTASSRSPTASALAYSQCMRAHGIKDFPDPDANGGLRLAAHPGSDIDPNNPTYQAADTACKSLLPPPQGPAKNLKAQNLEYAQCMRAHGISDFPDPQSDGTLQVQASPGGDLDPNDPRFKAAGAACKRYQPADGGAVNSAGSA